jgi:hypothetical protein
MYKQETRNSPEYKGLEQKFYNKHTAQYIPSYPVLYDIMTLQHTIGNQDVLQLLKRGEILTKLFVGNPDTPYEKEANTIADQVVTGNTTLIQQMDLERGIQRKSTGPGTPISSRIGTKIDSLQGKGKPLDKNIRDYFHPRFGVDLGDVRIHTDSNADKLARAVQARAFMHSRDMVFASGEYQPHTKSGKKLIAHELVHYMQQQGGNTLQRAGNSTVFRAVGDHYKSQINGLLLVSNPAVYKSTIQAALPERSVLKVLDEGIKESFNKTSDAYKWWKVEVISSSDTSIIGLSGWVMKQALAEYDITLLNIYNTYQVNDDAMISWSPKAGGLIPVPFIDPVRITETEGELLDNLTVQRGFMGLQRFRDIRDEAFSVSDGLYPFTGSTYPSYVPADNRSRINWIYNDGHRDAFRHAYWNALLTRSFGEAWTAEFCTAHEGIPGNSAAREAMDLYNNEVGRNIAVSNPNATDAEIIQLIQQANTNGELIVVNAAGELEWSDNVPLWQHGIAPQVSINGVIAVPQGDEYPH